MNPDLMKMLQELSQKMGTTIERLWPVLVAHAQTEATAYFVVCLTVACISLIAFASLVYISIKDKDEAPLLISLSALMLGVIMGSIAIIQYADMKYPEAAVIKDLIKSAK